MDSLNDKLFYEKFINNSKNGWFYFLNKFDLYIQKNFLDLAYF